MEISPWIEKHQEVHFLEVQYIDSENGYCKETFRINIYGDFFGIEIQDDEGDWEIYNEMNFPYLKGMHSFLKDKIQEMVYNRKKPISRPQDIRDIPLFYMGDKT